MNATIQNKMSHMKLHGMLRSYQTMLDSNQHHKLRVMNCLIYLSNRNGRTGKTKKSPATYAWQSSGMVLLSRSLTLLLLVDWIKRKCYVWQI